jgi:hypothetical protein
LPEYSKTELLGDQINHQTFITWLLNYSNVPNTQMDFLGYALNNSHSRDEFMRSVVMNLQDPTQVDAISDALDEARYAKLKQDEAKK